MRLRAIGRDRVGETVVTPMILGWNGPLSEIERKDGEPVGSTRLRTSYRMRPCNRSDMLAEQFGDDAGNCGEGCCKLRGILAAGFGDLRFAAA